MAGIEKQLCYYKRNVSSRYRWSANFPDCADDERRDTGKRVSRARLQSKRNDFPARWKKNPSLSRHERHARSEFVPTSRGHVWWKLQKRGKLANDDNSAQFPDRLRIHCTAYSLKRKPFHAGLINARVYRDKNACFNSDATNYIYFVWTWMLIIVFLYI